MPSRKRLSPKELPKDLRPREKMLSYGPEALDEAELWALVLGSGTKGFSVLEIGQKLSSLGFGKLKDLTLEDLFRIPGLGKAKAATVMAVLELCKRHAAGEEKPKITSPSQVEKVVRPLLKGQKEHLFVLSLSLSQRLLSVDLVALGEANVVRASPREVLGPVLKSGGYFFVLAHNHPDGDPLPSPEDRAFTRRIEEAARLLGLELLDHVVLGEKGFFSFRENKLLGDRW
ncbi:MAG: DNA repair protein RadC [Aquificae bacterium]|nr:DNA repair protein RadC [Aquificota bacterium]